MKKVSLIIPAAGKSSRFPNVRPKWMQTHPNGNMMFAESIKGIDLENVAKIYLVVLKEHVDKYDLVNGVEKQVEKIGVTEKFQLVILNEPTVDQPETVYECIVQQSVQGPIYIKDTDNYFEDTPEGKNSVAVFDLNECELINPKNKSYIQVDASNQVNSIVEKKVISSTFCVGGYSFFSAEEYVEYYGKNRSIAKELYISDLIHDMVLNDSCFEVAHVNNYKDWGTLDDWNRYKSGYATLFVDFDGTLVSNSGEYFPPYWGTTDALEDNVRFLNELHETGKVKIIITTSRKNEYREATIKQIKKVGLKYDQIIFELFHSKRIVINDYSLTNPYKSCDSLNLLRNSNDMRHMLSSLIG